MALKNKIFVCSLLIFISLSHTALAAKNSPNTPFPIQELGVFPVDYEKFGTFSGLGTHDYKYKITDRKGLGAAMGMGIFPNNGGTLLKDPGFYKWNKKKKAGVISPWEYVNTGDPQTDFYVWAQSNQTNPGTKLFFVAEALKEAGHIKQALKAYHAVLVHFPKDICWSADNTFFWYVSKAALSQITSLTESHPEFGYRLQGASFKVVNGDDADVKNDVFSINPGRWVPYSKKDPVDLKKLKIVAQRGDGKVRLVQYENKHWQLMVEGKPRVIHGITYMPTPIGSDLAEVANQWMSRDDNDDGLADAPYQSWVDANHNNKRDENEPDTGDFELMKKMGVNAIRLFQASHDVEYNPGELNKKVLRAMHEKYGIDAIMGHYLGAYTVSSGATWEEGTDYTNPVQLENMRQSVKDYVLDHRAEPYVLMWLLGNENLMPSDYSGVNATRTNGASHIEAYLKFVNEIAEMIHQLDPDHPVAVGNLDVIHLDEYAKFAPAVDIFGANSYRSGGGFGDLFIRVQENFDRPVLITEYGCDAFNSTTNQEEEEPQAKNHERAWISIQNNLGGGPEVGNSIGGVVFEFLDEWWKSQQGSFKTHETTKDSPMAFPDGWSSEEWYGMVSQGNGTESPWLRQPRKVYDLYRDKLWKQP